MLFGSILLREQGHVLISGSKIWIQTHGLHLCATQRPLGRACWLPYGFERIPTSYVPRLWRLRSRGSTILLNGRRRLVKFGQKQHRAGKQRGRRGLIRCVITMTALWRASGGTVWWEEYMFASASRAVGILEHVPERMCPTFPTSAFLFKKKSSIALNRMQSSVQLPPPPPLQLDVGGSGEIMRRRVKV